jgi:phosphoribosylformylglycinamidine cyclo-ligase
MRVVPKGRTLKVDWLAWQRPTLFRLIQEAGDVPESDMRRTFNLGIGMIVIAPPRAVDTLLRTLKKEKPVVVGEIG